jgi:hypothetical protein
MLGAALTWSSLAHRVIAGATLEVGDAAFAARKLDTMELISTATSILHFEAHLLGPGSSNCNTRFRGWCAASAMIASPLYSQRAETSHYGNGMGLSRMTTRFDELKRLENDSRLRLPR